MIGGKRVLGLIPARGGSKGIPRKNIALLAGKPLIAWTILAAQASKYLDRVILSSDDLEIIAVAEKWGCEAPFIRPSELARDETPGIEPVLHALAAVGEAYDYVVLLQPTSPLRSAQDIDGCLEHCRLLRAPACVSVSEPDKSPYWMYTIDAGEHLMPLLAGAQYQRRQDIPPVYALNGAVYVADCCWLQQHRTFVTPETVSYRMVPEHSIDIDTKLDLMACELLLTNKR